MNIETPYPDLAEQVRVWKVCRLLQIPSCLNIKGGVLAGGSVAQAVFDTGNYWNPQPEDYDIFVPTPQNGGKTKRIKVEYNATKLDLVFKPNDISDFDLSVCQIGINLDTNEVFATPLFLYSTKFNVMVCRISNFGVEYQYLYTEPVTHAFNHHLIWKHEPTFCYCNLCEESLKEEEEEYVSCITNWWDRVKKYYNRFPSYKLHFVKYE